MDFPLPENLPAPVDDGGSDHLPGLQLPDILLPATDGKTINLSQLSGRTIIYIYPMTGRPDVALPAGWNEIPGARGCTPQSCAFRDHHAELRQHGAGVFGLSVQSTDYQREAVARLHLPFALLSDEARSFQSSLNLPTFEADSLVLLKRLTLLIREGRIERVWYPVFPPNQNATDVLNWLAENPE